MWPQRPRRFAAAIAVHYGWVAYPWGLGVDFGPYLVRGHQGGLAFVGGGGKPKVSLLAKPLELELFIFFKGNQVRKTPLVVKTILPPLCPRLFFPRYLFKNPRTCSVGKKHPPINLLEKYHYRCGFGKNKTMVVFQLNSLFSR